MPTSGSKSARSRPNAWPISGSLCADPPCSLRARCQPQATAAFVLLGPAGTRVTLVPWIPQGATARVDAGEPARVAAAAKAAGCKRVALIAATRDDLADGGAHHLVQAIRAVRAAAPGTRVEMHASDLGGARIAQRAMLAARPDVLHHPLPACPRLAAKLVPGADYVRSLEWLRMAKEEFEAICVRSTLIVGLGETRDEAVASLADLRSVRVDELVITVPPPALRKATPNPDLVARLTTVATKLGFARLEVLTQPRACVAPEESNGDAPA